MIERVEEVRILKAHEIFGKIGKIGKENSLPASNRTGEEFILGKQAVKKL